MPAEPGDRQKLLSRDAALIREASQSYARFAFANILSAQLEKKGITRTDLGRRLGTNRDKIRIGGIT
ncbi:MAG: hypothetical protein LBF77_07495 [Spirochaetaceae bacterium]|jgi:hypothetical protein|nr:hypothetical protein [Spirochaetaceae bacterium]